MSLLIPEGQDLMTSESPFQTILWCYNSKDESLGVKAKQLHDKTNTEV